MLGTVAGLRAPNLGKGKIATIAAVLGVRIANGDFPTDRPLPVENELAQELKVGRSVLREAVKVLSSKGMLLVRPRHGTFVQPRSQWYLLDQDVIGWLLHRRSVDVEFLEDILAFRRIIEPAAAGLAARNATETDILAIDAAFADMRSSLDDPAAAIDADCRFHQAVFSASHNMLLEAFSPAITNILRKFFELSIENPAIFQANLGPHVRVADAIRRKDASDAFEAMASVLGATEGEIRSRLNLAASPGKLGAQC
jgi:GntR family transcriptional regulator, galactonate operon transcriptional repressor